MRTLTSRAIATAAAAAIVLTTMSLQPAAAGNRGEDAAALAVFAGILGTVAAIIASQDYNDHPYYSPRYTRGPVYRGPAYGPHGSWQRQHRHWSGRMGE